MATTTRLQRSFVVDPSVLATGHPYSVNPGSTSCTIQFYEFRGIGPPSSDFGQAGDVYVDLNPRLHALYWRERSPRSGSSAPGSWIRWTNIILDQVPLYRYLTPHPWTRHAESSDLFLWVDPAGVTWTSTAALCASRVKMIQQGVAPVEPGTMPDVQALVSQVLRHMIDAERERPTKSTDDRRWPHGSPSRRSSISIAGSPQNHRRSSVTLPFRPTSSHGPRSPPPPQMLAAGGHSSSPYTRPALLSEYSPRPGSSSPYPMYVERDSPDMRALDDMRRAQGAEFKSKQELKLKNRELAKLRQKEKDVISMSYHYQKRERELVAG
ncbi:hypothetical protein C8F01DRAFT_1366936 [Mycena amicta]|nr:hypothetical protein C8F01DRAFT_1366936 [Mycena amicta]